MLTGAVRTWQPSRLSLSTSSSASLSTLKQPMPSVQRPSHFARVLPTPEKMMSLPCPPAASTRSSSPPETMSKPQPAWAKHLEYTQRGIRLHRIADPHATSGKPALVGGQGRQHGGLRVDEQGCAVLTRQVGKPYLFGEQLPATEGEMRVSGDAGVAGAHGRGTGVAVPVAGAEAGGAGRVRVSGRVARVAAASPAGRNSGPSLPTAGQRADHDRGKEKPGAEWAD